MADAHLHESRSVALHSRLSFTTGMNNVNLTYGLRTYQIINSFDLGLPRRSLSWKFLPWTVGASHRRLGGHSRQPMCHTGPMRRVSCRGQFFFMKMDLIIFFVWWTAGRPMCPSTNFWKRISTRTIWAIDHLTRCPWVRPGSRTRSIFKAFNCKSTLLLFLGRWLTVLSL